MFEFTNKRPRTRSQSVDGFRPRTDSQGKPASVFAGELNQHNKTPQPTAQPNNDRMGQAFQSRGNLIAAPNYHSGNDKKPPKSKLKKGLRIFGVAAGTLTISALIVGGVIFGKAWLAMHKILQGGGSSQTLFSTDIQPEALKGEGDGRVNILLVGIGGGNRDGANLTDTIMIASIDPVAKDVALLSIPRDLWVNVEDYWSMKINAAYSSAMEQGLRDGLSDNDAEAQGFSALEGVIEKYIGVPIHYHALVNFQAFREGVDAVGGVDVQVEEDLYDYVIAPDNDGNPLIAKAGLQHFDGRHALLYSQSRYSSSDFARGERQRQVIIALKEKVLSSGTFSNPKTISSLLDALGDNVSVNASLGEIMRMYEITKDIPNDQIANVGFTDEGNVLVTTDNINGQSIVRPVAGLTNFSAIQSFVRNTLRDPFLKSENATIAVLNGTENKGLATEKANELKGYGYNVTIIDDAPTKDYLATVIYDRSGGAKKFTKSYLERRLNAQTATEPTSSNPILVTADFIVVLGSNETPTTTD